MSKGTRREQQACEIYEKAGYTTYRPATVQFGENDVYGLFDLIAMHPSRKPVYVQVKSNGARGITQWVKDAQALMPFEHATVHFAVPYDREGWRLIEVDSDGRETVYDERDDWDGKLGEGLANYLSPGLIA